ncbi:diaminopimelate decarboxylase [Buchnera aphidicola]|uniref:Diaminopimelate decarboxylase n=1 Tax=Buchnera aphidicola (Anoecia oenotherae) TaxID=1241833 RepID=A0A4D6XY95_9GAMM|nr:diaminopimelate decarboxylase [Buchnera aphidicola]QCI19454.1 diaminopimelate decarboxylase [Buchnera aphidicola (Anoecia oenotherae)]
MPCSVFTTKSELNKKNILNSVSLYKTPLWIYDANIIKNQVKKLNKFNVIRYAQKACSNIHILRLLKKYGVKIDAVSYGEIERALISGFNSKNDEIVYTADSFDENSLNKVVSDNITVNIGSIDMLHQLGNISPNHRIWIRVNPKFGYGHHKKTNTGGENSKHGIWDLQSAIKVVKVYNFKLVGIHMHIGSGVNYKNLKKVCESMLSCVTSLNYDISSISAGGGIPISYKLNQSCINIDEYFTVWNTVQKKLTKFFNHPITLEIEPGRFLVAESCILVAKVNAVKRIKDVYFVITDAGFNDLVRPVMYGSYHHISVISNSCKLINKKLKRKTVIAGPICESGDIFTQSNDGEVKPRLLPLIEIGDIIIFHDTGAYGSSMSSNYNSRPLIPEILFNSGKCQIIRRRQTISEMISLEL